jgi:hypothetical protein
MSTRGCSSVKRPAALIGVREQVQVIGDQPGATQPAAHRASDARSDDTPSEGSTRAASRRGREATIVMDHAGSQPCQRARVKSFPYPGHNRETRKHSPKSGIRRDGHTSEAIDAPARHAGTRPIR